MKTLSGKTMMISGKEAKLLEASAAGGSPNAAMDAAGYRPMSNKKAAEAFVRAIKKKYQDANGLLIAEMEHVGVTMSTVAERLKEGLDATTSKKSGKQVVEVPDFSTRHKYLETVMSVHGSKKPERQIVESVSSHENTVSIAEAIRENPELLIALKERIENKAKTIDVVPDEEDSATGGA